MPAENFLILAAHPDILFTLLLFHSMTTRFSLDGDNEGGLPLISVKKLNFCKCSLPHRDKKGFTWWNSLFYPKTRSMSLLWRVSTPSLLALSLLEVLPGLRNSVLTLNVHLSRLLTYQPNDCTAQETLITVLGICLAYCINCPPSLVSSCLKDRFLRIACFL